MIEIILLSVIPIYLNGCATNFKGSATAIMNTCNKTEIIEDKGTYCGDTDENIKEGTGTYQWKDGKSYTGEWKNDKMHGYGKAKLKNFTYEGNYKNGKFDGMGTLKALDGRVFYKGEYVQNAANGEGELFFPSGERYKGTFKNNKRNGKGTLYSADGSIIYEGDWIMGSPK